MRRPIIIANWKMNTKFTEAEILLSAYKNAVRHFTHVDVVICPPAVWLLPMLENLNRFRTHIKLGAQNVYFEDDGAYTGEISVRMLKGIADYVIVGHSERRKYFCEDHVTIIKKINKILEANLKPVICLGEQAKMPLKQRVWGKPIAIDKRNIIYRELYYILDNIKKSEIENLIIAYEPVWAIGTGEAANGAYAAAVISGMREILAEKVGEKIANKIRILYGGSVNSKNMAEFMHQPEIDGVLAGTSALKIRDFNKMVEIASEVRE